MSKPGPDQVPAAFRTLLAERGFQPVREHGPDELSFGNSETVLGSPSFRIRFVVERGHPMVDVAPAAGEEAWWDLGLLKAMVEGSGVYEATDLEGFARFLADHFDTVTTLLSESQFPQTARDLDALARRFAKERWPEWYKDPAG